VIALRNYQEDAIEALYRWFESEAGNPLVILPTGCHAKGTRVVMIDGTTKAVEDIQVGDVLIGPDSTPRNVLRTITGTEPMYRITPHRGSAPFVVNENHVLSLMMTNERKAFPSSTKARDTEFVAVKDYLAKSKSWKHLRKLHRAECVHFTMRDDPELDPWALGALLGDGCLKHGVNFTNPDHDVLDALLEVMRSHGLEFSEKTYAKTQNVACWHVRFVNSEGRNGHVENRVTTLLKKIGVFGLSAGDKFIPDEYKMGSVKTRAGILAGLLDTDGYLNKGVAYDFISKSRRLSEDVAFISRSLGLPAAISECQKTCQTGGGGTYWRVSITGESSWLPLRCLRKRSDLRTRRKNPLVTGFKIEPIGEGEFFGFSLDGNHLYLTDDFVVHHNSGKSVVQAAFIERAFQDDPACRVLCVTHVKELIAQNWQRLRQIWPSAPAGVNSASLNRRDTRHPILFAGVQSIYKLVSRIDAFDLVIIDEAHLIPHAGEGMYRQLLAVMKERNPWIKVIGLTATPYRLDSGLLVDGDVFDGVAYELPMQRLISEGSLVEVISKGSLQRANLSAVHTRQGEFVDAEAEEAMMAVTEAALDEACNLAADRRGWLLFCVTVKHAHQVADSLIARGISSAVVTGKTPQSDRDAIIRDFQAGKVRALVNVKVLTTGFDAPRTDCLVSLRPTLSAGLWVQICGRGMRPSPGKENCLLLDYAGNIARHGPIDQIQGRRKKSSSGEVHEAPTRKCPRCEARLHASLRVCPECGCAMPEPDQAQKIGHSASDMAVLSSQKNIRDLAIDDLFYDYHLGKSGTPTMRVTYCAGVFTRVSEYICFEHQGYARAKAAIWWQRRCTDPVPETVSEALEMAHALAEPTHMRVSFGGKFPELITVEFRKQEAA